MSSKPLDSLPAAVQVRGIGVAGQGGTIHAPLDEMVFEATVRSLASAGMAIDDVDVVVMASSDLLDGRAISTMTLSGAAGAFGKTEVRLCDDSLGALGLAAALIRGGAAETAICAAWSKLTDSRNTEFEALGLDPAVGRPVLQGLHTQLELLRSRSSGRVSMTDPNSGLRIGGDGAVTLVLGEPRDIGSGPWVLGTGTSLGRYLGSPTSRFKSLRLAVERALTDSGIPAASLARVVCSGFPAENDQSLIQWLLSIGVSARLERLHTEEYLGYLGGLQVVSRSSSYSGYTLIVSSAGIAYQAGHAAVICDALHPEREDAA